MSVCVCERERKGGRKRERHWQDSSKCIYIEQTSEKYLDTPAEKLKRVYGGGGWGAEFNIFLFKFN